MAVVGVTTTHPAEALHEADLVLPDLRGMAERLRDPRGPFGT
jgi:hypothetical protein